MRRIAWALVLIAVLPARSGAADWRASMAGLLQKRSAAVVSGARVAFDATMSLAPASFRKAKDAWFERVRALGIGSYALESDPAGFADLAPALRAPPVADEVHVADVIQHFALRGVDRAPSADNVFFTIVRRGTTWSIVSDSDLEDLGFESVRDLWDFAAVTPLRSNGVLVLSHHDARAAAIASITAAAAARDHRVWPLRWGEPLVAAVPASRAELQRIMEVTFDLGPFVAFTTSSLDRTAAGYHLTASRIYVQPQNFFSDPSGYRNDTLGHEIIHLATRSRNGIFSPAWLDEGVAQVYGQQSVVTTFHGAAVLPEDWEFTVGSGADINNAYARAASFVTWMRAHLGNAAPARLYAALGAENADSFGTSGYHLDRASRIALGKPFDAIMRAWRRAGR